MRLRFFIAGVLAAVLCAGQPLLSQSDTDVRFTVVPAGPGSIVVNVAGLRPVPDGAGRTTLNTDKYSFRPDSTFLPEIRLILGVPHDAENLRVEIPERKAVAMSSRMQGTLRESTGAVEVFPGGEMRGIRTVGLLYRPFHREGGQILCDTASQIRISWDRSGGMSDRIPVKEYREIPSIAAGLQATILNYAQAQQWRTTMAPSATRLAGASGWGLDEPSLVISVPNEGVYTLTGADLASAGLPSGVNVADLRMRNRDERVPLFVVDGGASGVLDADDEFLFRGKRNPGDSGIYYSEITDTNVYILTWSGGAGAAPVAAGTGRPQIDRLLTAYDSTFHFEREEQWFGGLRLRIEGDEATLFVNERVQQERFYWRDVALANQVPLEFTCSPVYDQDGQSTLNIMVAGGIYDPMEFDGTSFPVMQNLDVYLNGIDIGTVTVQDTSEVVVSLSFQTNYLVNGTNTLRFILQPIDQEGIIRNSIRIDYLELEGSWLPLSDGGPLVLPVSSQQNAGMPILGFAEAPDRAVFADHTLETDSLEKGLLFRLTSRNDANIRNYPGFFAVVGDEQIESPGNSLGISIIEVEPGSEGGRIVRSEHFSTIRDDWAQRFADAADFVADVEPGNIVLAGLAFGTARQPGDVPEDFIREFELLGSTIIGKESLFVGGWCFAAQKGSPGTAVEAYSRNNRGTTLNAFFPDSDGNSWRAVVPVSGDTPGEVLVGKTRKPELRYHEKDELLAGENQADMIMIVHPRFRAEAERLAEHRRNFSNLTVKLVDIYQIYDEFNDGVKSPVAIRRFLQYADSNWAAPKPGYVVLFGDASWDAAHRMEGSVMVDYVPSFGVPSSDHIYTVAFGDTTLMPRQYLGRLPVKTEQEARDVVDKIIEYDLQPPARWHKKFVFGTGGDSVFQRDKLKGYAENYVLTYITPATFYGEGLVIARSGDTDEELRLPKVNDPDGALVREELHKGALWFDFNGHGSTTTIDLNYGVPENFDNDDRYFVLSTWSCQTGLFSEPSASLRNEGFVTVAGKGSIASIGATSFSFTDVDNQIRTQLYANITEMQESRSIGELFMNAKYEMFVSANFGAFENIRTHSRNHVMSYNLLGDPAMHLALDFTPELALPTESATLTNDRNGTPDLGDTVAVVKADLWSYGSLLPQQFLDSGVVVSATLQNENGDAIVLTDTVKGLTRFQSLEFRFPLAEEPGEYLIRIVADPQEEVGETYREDNVLTFNFLLRGSQPLTLEPLAYALLPKYDDVTIRVLNPQSGPGARFELDTVPTFDSPGLISSDAVGKVTETELVTLWDFSIPEQLRSAQTFWWKAVSTSGNAGDAEKFPLIESFSVRSNVVGHAVQLEGLKQLAETRIEDLTNTAEGVGPGTRQVPIAITAIGQSRIDTLPGSPQLQVSSFLSMIIGTREYRVNAPAGINILVLPENDITPVADTVFNVSNIDFDENVRLEAFEDFVANVVQPGQRVLLASSGTSFQVDTRYENGVERLITVLKTLGSTIADDLDIEDSYILIGGKGIPSDQVKESWLQALPLRRAGEFPPFTASLRDTVTAIPRGGRWTSPVFGPATSWRNARFILGANSSAAVEVAVVGIKRDGVRDTVARTAVSFDNPVVDLTTFDSLVYPRIELVGQFTNDTALRLRAAKVDFQPSPELAIVPSTVVLSSDSVLQGDPVAVEATIANLTSFQSARSVLTTLNPVGEVSTLPVDSTRTGEILPLDSVRVTLDIDTRRMQSNRLFVLNTNAVDLPSEPYIHNNRQSLPILRIGPDGIPPGFAIYADECRLISGDFVPPDASLEVRVYDNSLIELDSTASVTMVLDNKWITALEGGGVFQPVDKGDDDLVGLFRYSPPEPLEDGPHDLRVFIKDAAGNGDTSEVITFFVERDLGLRQVLNWPNPFERETSFTFILTGEGEPESGEIAIYTPAGRKIRTIRLYPGDVKIGFNKVDWDGLDEDRDRLANGVYFYRLKVKVGDQTVEAIEKIAVLR